jgi:hypothetical protein
VVQGVEGVGHRERAGGDVQDLGHLVPGGEQSAEDDLREEERRHELDGLELARREGRGEEAEGHAEHRVDHREGDRGRDGAGHVEAEEADRDRGDDE